MKSKKLTRLILFILSLASSHPSTAYADPKVYFEKDCLALFTSHQAPTHLANDETKVEESRSHISFEKLTVTESRDGAVVDTYIQVRNCRAVEANDHL